MTNDVSFVELGRFSMPGMRVRVRLFPLSDRRDHSWRVASDLLSFSRVIGQPGQSKPGGGKAMPARPLTFWPRSTLCAKRASAGQVLAISTYFDTQMMAGVRNAGSSGIPIDDFSMVELMQLLHDEVTAPGLSSGELVAAIGDILRIKLARLLAHSQRMPEATKPCRSAEVAMLHGMIKSSAGRLPTQTELSTQLDTSRRSLYRLFKAATGTAPSRYVDEMKLDRAKTLLATSTLSLKQIGYAVGFATPSHFSTRFRQLTGMTPGEFRNRARRYA